MGLKAEEKLLIGSALLGVWEGYPPPSTWSS
jgi:hypothetical protein